MVGAIEGISFVYFDDRDVVRHKLVQQIVKAYEAFTTGNARAPPRGCATSSLGGVTSRGEPVVPRPDLDEPERVCPKVIKRAGRLRVRISDERGARASGGRPRVMAVADRPPRARGVVAVGAGQRPPRPRVEPFVSAAGPRD